MKYFFRSIVTSIGISTFIFCVVSVIFDLANGGNFTMTHYSFTKMVLASVITGIGFGAPTVVYSKESIPLAMQALIHMGIGCVVYTIVAFWAGWIPTGVGVWKCVISIVVELAVAFVIWNCYRVYYRSLGRKINQKIRKMNQ